MRGALKCIFRQMNCQLLVIGTFAEMSYNAKAFIIAIVVEYGVEHLGRSMAAPTHDFVS
jgi:hypothetical protein